MIKAEEMLASFAEPAVGPLLFYQHRPSDKKA